MAIKIGLAVLIAVLILLVVVSMQPGIYRVARTTTVAAPPSAVYAQVADFHRWAAWSPWEKLDPEMKRTFSGPDSGPGAAYAWTGNNKVGEGRMTLVSAQPPSSLSIKLEFLRPMSSTSTATFTLVPGGAGTEVTWAMEGSKNFLSKAFFLFASPDKLIGGDFDRGLAQLKSVSETQPAAIPAAAK